MDFDSESGNHPSALVCAECTKSGLVFSQRQSHLRLLLTWSVSANALLLILLLAVWFIEPAGTQSPQLQSDALLGDSMSMISPPYQCIC